MEELTAISVYRDLSLPVVQLNYLVISLLISLPAAAFIGHRAGRARRDRANEVQRDILSQSGETTLGAILALLGLLVAFSFGNALSWAEARKQAIVIEANALGTAFLRADFLDEPGRTELKQALYDYAQTRLRTLDRRTSADAALALVEATLAAQARLWPITLEATADPLPAATKSFVASSINDVIDSHTIRLSTVNRPATDVTGMMVVAAALMGLFLVGNRSALQGRPLTWRTFVFAGFLWVVLCTIADLQRALEGTIQTNYALLEIAVLDMRVGLAGGG